jgi:hypothetical protein
VVVLGNGLGALDFQSGGACAIIYIDPDGARGQRGKERREARRANIASGCRSILCRVLDI